VNAHDTLVWLFSDPLPYGITLYLIGIVTGIIIARRPKVKP
jgi:hypothetical protein